MMSCKRNVSVSSCCTDVVLYDPPVVIAPFHEKARQLFLCGRHWSLVQDWNQQGVAGVLWEAVSHTVYHSHVLVTCDSV